MGVVTTLPLVADVELGSRRAKHNETEPLEVMTRFIINFVCRLVLTQMFSHFS